MSEEEKAIGLAVGRLVGKDQAFRAWLHEHFPDQQRIVCRTPQTLFSDVTRQIAHERLSVVGLASCFAGSLAIAILTDVTQSDTDPLTVRDWLELAMVQSSMPIEVDGVKALAVWYSPLPA